MSEFRADEEWEEDEEPEPLPIWRRRKWLLIGLGVVVLLAFLFTRGKPQHAPDAAKGEAPYIGVVVPYQAAKAEAPAISPSTATAAPTPVPAQPPIVPSFRVSPALANAPPVRPAMLSYAVPHSDGAETSRGARPADPPQTGLAFAASSLPGIKASPAIDDTYQLMPGLLALRARYRDRERLARPIAVPSAGAGLQPQGRLVNGGRDADRRPL